MKINPFRAAVGFLILFISVVFFLTNSGLAPWNIWLSVWQFWPILFVIFGVAFLMKRWDFHYLIGISIFIIIFAVTGVGLWIAWENQYFGISHFSEINEANIAETRISNELPKKLEDTDVKIVFGTSKIKISSIPDVENNLLYKGTHFSNFFTLNQRLDTFGNNADLTFKASPFIKKPFNSKSINELNLNFSQKIKYSFDIRSGASEIDLGLEALEVKNLKIDAGASKIVIRFGQGANTNARIKAGASSLKFYVPKGLGIKINTKSALTSNNFEDFGLVKKNKSWKSKDWDEAENRVNIELESGISKVELVE